MRSKVREGVQNDASRVRAEPRLTRRATTVKTTNGGLTERSIDGGYEFAAAGQVVGRLLWLDAADDIHASAGWWLEVPRGPARRLYDASGHQPEALAAARRRSEATCLAFADEILGDWASGMFDRAAFHVS